MAPYIIVEKLGFGLESVLPSFVFLYFLIFIAKLKCLKQRETYLFVMKWSSLSGKKTGKLMHLQKKEW
jgi:hypothetical protein